jgi:phage FluMu protein Com
MATIAMRQVRDGEVPRDGGTAIQDDPDRPVFHGNGPDDYVCVQCGNVLAESMDAAYMTKRVRVKCARCKTVNVAITDESEPRRPRGSGSGQA